MYKSLWGRGGGRADFYTGGVCVTAGYFNRTCRRRLLPRSPTRWSTSPPFWRGLAGRGSERSGRSCCCCRPRRLTEVSEASTQNQTLVLIVHVTARLGRFIKEAKPQHDYMKLVMNEESKYNRVHVHVSHAPVVSKSYVTFFSSNQIHETEKPRPLTLTSLWFLW